MRRLFSNLFIFSVIALLLASTATSCHSVSVKDGKKKCYYVIYATPKGATIRIDGKKRDSIFIVSPGSVVSWEVSKKGYITQSGTDTISGAGSRIVQRVSLQEKPKYTIRVLVEPEDVMKHAHISINGKESSTLTANYGEMNTIKVSCDDLAAIVKTGKKDKKPFLKYLTFFIVALLGGLLFVLYRRKKHNKDKAMDLNTPASTLTNSEPVKNGMDLMPCPRLDIAPTLPLVTPSIIGTKRKGQDIFAILAKDWEVVGASVQGNGHKSSNVPCQDSCAYEYLKDGWGIAITSDGAGSAEHSDVGSKITVARAMNYLKKLIEDERWIEKKELPTDNSWTHLATAELRKVRDDIYGFAEKNKIEFKSLSATIIVVIHSPYGLLVAHVGDGRAGFKGLDGGWHSIITPHKGEEANQTIFLTSGFWDIPFFELSGVMVPETRVIRQPVAAFTLMSDGCENTSWLCNLKDEKTGHFYDPNKPFHKFFDPLIVSLGKESIDGTTEDEIENNWQSFISDGTTGFVAESDDKTMVLGLIRE